MVSPEVFSQSLRSAGRLSALREKDMMPPYGVLLLEDPIRGSIANFESLAAGVGNTPLLRIPAPPNVPVRLLVKPEGGWYGMIRAIAEFMRPLHTPPLRSLLSA
jgi:hypothetical protein